MKSMRREQGFTLIELMIVVAIIAIIAAIAIPSLLNARKAGNEASAISSLRTLSTVNEQYRTRFQEYPERSRIGWLYRQRTRCWREIRLRVRLRQDQQYLELLCVTGERG